MIQGIYISTQSDRPAGPLLTYHDTDAFARVVIHLAIRTGNRYLHRFPSGKPVEVRFVIQIECFALQTAETASVHHTGLAIHLFKQGRHEIFGSTGQSSANHDQTVDQSDGLRYGIPGHFPQFGKGTAGGILGRTD